MTEKTLAARRGGWEKDMPMRSVAVTGRGCAQASQEAAVSWEEKYAHVHVQEG
eukprot:COSAG01_NODE_2297_length_7966_cov_145.938604_1_plen_53_part_00